MKWEDLPPDVQQAAKVDDNGEVEWSAASARAAIEALASAGAVILGLDLRDYREDGRFVEIAWTSFAPTGGSDDPQRSGAAALAALDRPEVAELGLAGASVLVTWERA